jgi:hypothetical protein
MKIIPKIALCAAIILFLSTLNEKADSQVEPPKPNAVTNKNRTKIGVIPYSMNGTVKIKNPIYIETVTLNSNLELDH